MLQSEHAVTRMCVFKKAAVLTLFIELAMIWC